VRWESGGESKRQAIAGPVRQVRATFSAEPRTTRCCQTKSQSSVFPDFSEDSLSKHPHLRRLVMSGLLGGFGHFCILPRAADTRQFMRLFRLTQRAQSARAAAPCTQRWHADPAAENTPMPQGSPS
jgi:hypothetical protein